MLTIITEAPPWVFRWVDPIHDGSFSELLMDGWGEGGEKSPSPFPKIFHTYPTLMKLGTDIPYLKAF